MINWLHQEEGFCEGCFESKVFHDEDGDELSIAMQSPDLSECAEKCVAAFQNLTESNINEICKGIINCAKEGGIDNDFELPELENAIDILNYCWFTTLYVNMLNKDDEIAYVVEGEGEWGDDIGFAIENNKIIYVGTDYFDYMKDRK
jgi:hypothetical protein